MTYPIDHDDSQADGSIALFPESRLVEEKTHIRGEIDDHGNFLRQAKQGSVEIERGIQLRIGFRTSSAYEP